jgi:hypothetical protein
VPARNRSRKNPKNPKNRNRESIIPPVTRSAADEVACAGLIANGNNHREVFNEPDADGPGNPGSSHGVSDLPVDMNCLSSENKSQMEVEGEQALAAAHPLSSYTASDVPEDVARLLTDLLMRQHHWQQQQSQSEQLIARLADQLDQSQRMIDSLVANNLGNENESGAASYLTSEPSNGTHESGSEESFSWEQQKKKLLQGDFNEPLPAATPRKPASSAARVIEAAYRPGPETPPPKPAHVCPNSLSLESRIEHELGQLDDSEQSRRVRWLRERLEERLREAEIEISIERARLIRERRELENSRSDFEAEVARSQQNSPARGRRTGSQDGGNRWMRFLGR